jgi:hypothetical protein
MRCMTDNDEEHTEKRETIMIEYMQAFATLMAFHTFLRSHSNQGKAYETPSSQSSEALPPFRFPPTKTPALAAAHPVVTPAPAHDTPLAA